jgi:hypothetical protein
MLLLLLGARFLRLLRTSSHRSLLLPLQMSTLQTQAVGLCSHGCTLRPHCSLLRQQYHGLQRRLKSLVVGAW